MCIFVYMYMHVCIYLSEVMVCLIVILKKLSAFSLNLYNYKNFGIMKRWLKSNWQPTYL